MRCTNHLDKLKKTKWFSFYTFHHNAKFTTEKFYRYFIAFSFQYQSLLSMNFKQNKSRFKFFKYLFLFMKQTQPFFNIDLHEIIIINYT